MNKVAGDDLAERRALLAALAWQQAMGVDAAVIPETVDWLARGDEPPLPTNIFTQHATHTGAPGPKAQSFAGVPQQGLRASQDTLNKSNNIHNTAHFSAASPQNAVEISAKEAARAALTLAALRDALAGFDGCGLKTTAKNLCFFRGAEHARVMVIGEAPGRDEDFAGRPFVGRAGQLLDKMLGAIDLDESLVHFTNVVYWRPPGNRTPTPQEVLVCRPFLERQIDLVAPEFIITVGGPAAKAILDTPHGIMKSRGKWGTMTTLSGATVRIMPTLHPAYLLRNPASKCLTWRDLLAVREALQQAKAPPSN